MAILDRRNEQGIRVFPKELTKFIQTQLAELKDETHFTVVESLRYKGCVDVLYYRSAETINAWGHSTDTLPAQVYTQSFGYAGAWYQVKSLSEQRQLCDNRQFKEANDPSLKKSMHNFLTSLPEFEGRVPQTGHHPMEIRIMPRNSRDSVRLWDVAQLKIERDDKAAKAKAILNILRIKIRSIEMKALRTHKLFTSKQVNTAFDDEIAASERWLSKGLHHLNMHIHSKEGEDLDEALAISDEVRLDAIVMESRQKSADINAFLHHHHLSFFSSRSREEQKVYDTLASVEKNTTPEDVMQELGISQVAYDGCFPTDAEKQQAASGEVSSITV